MPPDVSVHSRGNVDSRRFSSFTWVSERDAMDVVLLAYTRVFAVLLLVGFGETTEPFSFPGSSPGVSRTV